MTVPDRGADASAPRSEPLKLVAGAVGGDTLEDVAASVADALGCPVAIAIPAHDLLVVSPPGALGDQEASAIAASVTALIGEAPGSDSGQALLAEVAAGPVDDLPGVLDRARRLGVELSAGGVALSAVGAGAAGAVRSANGHPALMAELRPGRLVAVSGVMGELTALAAALRARGMTVALSSARRDPALLHEAIHEAELLSALGGVEDPRPDGDDETYRLLIGVLLRDRGELEQLRHSTVASLVDYDARHDTDLLDTLRAFLGHDGSTTETADALQLHRHTVGYRLSRVQEVSGLSPYESGGRERLSLGLKAHQILAAALSLEAC